MKNQILNTIMTILVKDYFPTVGLPETILTDNGGQFLTHRWHDFANDNEFEIRKTTPYNPQSNPVERAMRELGRVIRTYASKRHTNWDRIIIITESVINATAHSSTGFSPDEFHMDGVINLEIDPVLKPEQYEEFDRVDKIEIASRILERAANKKKVQFNKFGTGQVYQVGEYVWRKIPSILC